MGYADEIRSLLDPELTLRKALENIIRLYPDKLHFVYELLQNAEDAEATKIKFIQYPDRLEVMHDGRPFTTKNLRALCDVGFSSKADDLNKIGEFGVGFKAVYGICDTVYLYSQPNEDEVSDDCRPVSFIIKDFTRPENAESRDVPAGYTTLFVFPYCVGKSFSSFNTVNQLNRKLSDRLNKLGSTTLLFMKNLKRIEYYIDFPDKKIPGCYIQKRKDLSSSCCFIETLGKTRTSQNDASYLVFSREIEGMAPRTIDVAFSMIEGTDGVFHFRPTDSPYVSVYFPTGTESKLPFIVQGPYVTTPNRSEIPVDNDANHQLAKMTADLLYDSIVELRDMDQISLELLSLLPLETPSLIDDWLFKPLYERTKDLFKDEQILPCMSGGYTDAPHAMIGRRNQKLSTVFPEETMSELKSDTDDEGNLWQYKWLPTDLTENTFGVLRDYLTDEHHIFEIRLEHLVRMIEDNPDFLPGRSDEWIKTFYDFLDEFNSTLLPYDGREKNLFDVPIIKTQSGKFVAPYNRKINQPNIFMPGAGTISGIEYVAEPFATDCANFMTKRLLLKVPSYKDKIYKVIVPRYASGDNTNEIEDFKICFNYYKQCPNEELDEYTCFIRECAFVRSYSKINGEIEYGNNKASALYFPDEDLEAYFSVSDCIWFVDFDFYLDLFGESENKYLHSFLSELGVSKQPRLIATEPEINNIYAKNHNEAQEYCEKENIYWPGKGKDFSWMEWRIQGCTDLICNIRVLIEASEDCDSEIAAKVMQIAKKQSVVLWNQLQKVCTPLSDSKKLTSKLTGICSYSWHGLRNGYYITKEMTLLKSSPWLFTQKGDCVSPDKTILQALSTEYKVEESAAQELIKFLGIQSQPESSDDNLTDEQRNDIAFAKKFKEKGITEDDLDELLQIKQSREANHLAAKMSPTGNAALSSDEPIDSANIYRNAPEENNIPRSVPRIYEEISRRKPRQQQSKETTKEETDSFDEDEYTPRSVDYQKKIEKAKDKSKAEIEEIAALEELQNLALNAEKYSFAWFKALLQLEAMNNPEGNSQSREISISFGQVEREPGTERTLVLKQPSRYIPQSIEELSDIPLVLQFGDQRKSVAVEVVNIQSYTLRAKLKSGAEIDGLDLSKVTEAKIDAKSPSFLLEELLNQFEQLPLEDDDNLQEKLCENIEFVFGPPGTGKTTHLAQKVLIPLMNEKEDYKVLVLTPTNKAANVLAKRILECKAASKSPCEDWLVRFGSAADESIEQSGIFREKVFDIRTLKRNVTITTIARFPYDFFMPSGDRLFLNALKWDYIIIDEASMIPLANIVFPLYKKTPKKFIIAGDPFQIEPITSVDLWKNENIYTMVKLDSFTAPKTIPHDYPVTLLTTQYRSIPTVGDIFNKLAYGGILSHYRKKSDQKRTGAEKKLGLSSLNIIRFPVSKYESIYRAKKLQNSPYQAYSALFTYEYIKYYADLIGQSCKGHFNIGIIAPYRAQADLVDKLVSSVKLPENVSVQVGTIHGFQGDECNVIFALFNPPPYISNAPEMFLNKLNIINVAVSRARDYLFVIMPDDDTENIHNLRLVNQIEKLCLESGDCSEFNANELEKKIFGNDRYLEENSFSTGHQSVNVYGLPEQRYEIRSEDTAIDIQIHDETKG